MGDEKVHSYGLLIVDDFPEDVEQLTDLAERAGLVVLASTRNAADTIAFLQDHSPDCALVDYRLGPDDGVSLLEVLSKRWPDLPTVAMSGQGNDQISVASRKAGAVRYLTKRGLDSEMLRSAVEEAMRWKRHTRNSR
ncbi:response regulator [Sagittula sp. S175]|uniref:response regulator n=1 Tax=Sagittula sp. S175 TaxID=3415129 RepID=UPI003C7C61F4